MGRVPQREKEAVRARNDLRVPKAVRMPPGSPSQRCRNEGRRLRVSSIFGPDSRRTVVNFYKGLPCSSKRTRSLLSHLLEGERSNGPWRLAVPICRSAEDVSAARMKAPSNAAASETHRSSMAATLALPIAKWGPEQRSLEHWTALKPVQNSQFLMSK